MKLGEAIPKYQAYRNQLLDEKSALFRQLTALQEKADCTGDQSTAEEAAELQLAYDEKNTLFETYNGIVEQLREQWCNAANAESAKALADPENGLAATLGKIMTTVARMCAGDKVPYTDEKKVMEYDSDMYLSAKQAQMAMAALKKRQKEYDSLWEEEGGEYNATEAADNTAAPGGLPPVPASGEASAPEASAVTSESSCQSSPASCHLP